MAIKRKSQQSILTERPESLDFQIQDSGNVPEERGSASDMPYSDAREDDEPRVARIRHKSVDNWGRPRKELIKGVKEVAITVQLPETLIKALRRMGKKDGRSMKDMIGSALLEKYKDIL